MTIDESTNLISSSFIIQSISEPCKTFFPSESNEDNHPRKKIKRMTFPSLQNKKEESFLTELRFKTFQKKWEECTNIIHQVVDKNQNESVMRIMEFIDCPFGRIKYTTSSRKSDIEEDTKEAAEEQSSKEEEDLDSPPFSSFVHRFREVPTGLIYRGYFAPGNDRVFDELKRQCATSGHRMALLEAKKVPTLRKAFAIAVNQLMKEEKETRNNDEESNLKDFKSQSAKESSQQNDHESKSVDESHAKQTANKLELLDNVDDEEIDDTLLMEEDEEEIADYLNTFKSGKKMKKIPLYDLELLESWLTFKKDSNDPINKLVIAFKDLEGFEPQLLMDFVSIACEYYPDLPLVFLFGLSTSTETIHQIFSRNIICHLQFQKFRLLQNSEVINEIVEKLFLKRNSGLRLSNRVFSKLVDDFKLYNFSIPQFIESLHYIYMDHYYGNPLSILTDLNCEDPYYDDVIEKLNDDHVLQVKMFNSFQTEMETLSSSDPPKAKNLLCSDEDLKWEIMDYVGIFESYHQRYFGGFLCLLELQKTAKSATLNKTIMSLYLLGINENLYEHEHVKMLLMLIKRLDVYQIKSLLEGCIGVLDSRLEDVDAMFGTYREKLEEFLEYFNSSEDEEDEDEQHDDDEEDDENGSPSKMNTMERSILDYEYNYILKHGKMAQSSLDLTKLQSNERKTKTALVFKPIIEDTDTSTFEGFLNSVKLFFADMFKDTLKNYTTQPLHELIYYDNYFRLVKAFGPLPRAAIQKALYHPDHYLGSKFKTEHDIISPNSPDACIAYRLYLECGRMINLHDWYIAFASILNNGELKIDEQESYARFRRAVSELLFCGFVKPTSRKQDHMVRLTWGSQF